jgi:lipoprotein-anchoring transpeptidase ErfK/SrfK
MKQFTKNVQLVALCVISVALTSCASTKYRAGFHGNQNVGYVGYSPSTNYGSRLPDRIDTAGNKVIYVDPNAHAWGAYDTDGTLVRAGLATAGGEWCDDIDKECKTDPGKYRIQSLGGPECVSRKYPVPKGGGLMPYCMPFNNGQALHGSPDNTVVEANLSHGCVRMRIPDAEWIRYNFASVGTKVVVEPY